MRASAASVYFISRTAGDVRLVDRLAVNAGDATAPERRRPRPATGLAGTG
eukprot:SAG31_NODE_3237_length_4508_cov_28.486278_2_plen_50_part_00